MAVHAARVKGHAAVLAKASGRSACEERVEERVQAAVARCRWVSHYVTALAEAPSHCSGTDAWCHCNTGHAR